MFSQHFVNSFNSPYQHARESDTLQAPKERGGKTLPRTSQCLGCRDVSTEGTEWLTSQGDEDTGDQRSEPCQALAQERYLAGGVEKREPSYTVVNANWCCHGGNSMGIP